MAEQVVECRDLDPGTHLEIETDVLVIGTGAGGGAFASELAEAGVDVVMLEDGGYYRTKDFTSNAPDMVKMLYRNAGSSIVMGKPNVFFQEGRCVGGSTVINAGISWRTPDRILKRWDWEHGLDRISSEEMAPFFEKVEARVHVSQQEEISYGADTWLMKEGAEKLGYRWMPVMRNQKFCVGTNQCIFGCPTGAKQSVLLTYVPRALQNGARLYSDCRADKIEWSGDRATAVLATLQNAHGKKIGTMRVKANEIVVSCGATQTPLLLQRSRVKDPHKQIGANMMLHPNCKVLGIFDQPVMGWKGAIQGVQITEFMEEGLMFATTFVPPSIVAISLPYFGTEAAAAMQHLNHMVTSGVLVEDTDSVGRVRAGLGGEAHLTYRLGPHDFHRLRRGAALSAEIHFAAGAKKVLMPFHTLKEISSPSQIRRVFDPDIKATDMEVLTVHAMCTARMGSDPRHSVTDSSGRMHALNNVTVADASSFPSPIGVNPQITIMALATRNAWHMLERRNVAPVTTA